MSNRSLSQFIIRQTNPGNMALSHACLDVAMIGFASISELLSGPVQEGNPFCHGRDWLTQVFCFLSKLRPT